MQSGQKKIGVKTEVKERGERGHPERKRPARNTKNMMAKYPSRT